MPDAFGVEVGIKSDPIEYRYSFEWLFRLMGRHGIRIMQLGSFHELYSVEEGYLDGLRELGARYGVRVKSCFTAHRELGGFFTGNRFLEKAARSSYERLIRVGAALGADFVGGSAGFVYRDRPELRETGMSRYLAHMRELMELARQSGLRGLVVEVMSSSFEPPSTPREIASMMEELSAHHRSHPSSTVPVYLCGDVSHGLCDASMRVLHGNMELFELSVPWMAEFHFKNTDAAFNSTFGFSAQERSRGIVRLEELRAVIERNADRFPVSDLAGYLEHPGPKLGRDYSDVTLERALEESLAAILAVFRDPADAGERGPSRSPRRE